jgi:FAD-linked oxidoreductase
VSTPRWRNWAGNQRGRPREIACPATLDELAEVVVRARSGGRRVKVAGSGHSFTGIALAEDIRLELPRAGPPLREDPGPLVTVPAGMTLRRLNAWLAGEGLALPNLGDIDAQTIAGAIATGTHGTGAGLGGLATQVAGMRLVTGTGAVLRCSEREHPDVFAAARVGLGALGVVTEVTLRCVEAFVLRADERPLPVAEALAGFEEHCASNDHVEFYWMPYTERTLLKRNNRTDVDSSPMSRLAAWWENDFLQNVALGAVCRLGRAAPAAMPRLARLVAGFFTPVTYTNRSDRIFTTPRRVRFVEMEYALPREALPEAFAALRQIVAGLPFKVILPVEVRVGAADDAWLSPGFGRDSVYIAIHQYVGAPYEEYFRAFEEVCAGLAGRPHWGKLHWRDAASLAAAYPRFADFRAVRDRLDPDRVFANAYLDRVLGA